MRDTSNTQNYTEYIINLIFIDNNLLFLNEEYGILSFIAKCEELQQSSKILALTDNDTLVSYDTVLRLFAHVIYEKVPEVEEIDLPNTPSFEDFKKWFVQLSDNSTYTILNYLSNRGYINIDQEEDFQFIINVLETLQVLER